jgi:predicted transposase YdaD
MICTKVESIAAQEITAKAVSKPVSKARIKARISGKLKKLFLSLLNIGLSVQQVAQSLGLPIELIEKTLAESNL